MGAALFATRRCMSDISVQQSWATPSRICSHIWATMWCDSTTSGIGARSLECFWRYMRRKEQQCRVGDMICFLRSCKLLAVSHTILPLEWIQLISLVQVQLVSSNLIPSVSATVQDALDGEASSMVSDLQQFYRSAKQAPAEGCRAYVTIQLFKRSLHQAFDEDEDFRKVGPDQRGGIARRAYHLVACGLPGVTSSQIDPNGKGTNGWGPISKYICIYICSCTVVMHLNCFGSSIVPEQKQWHRYIMRKQDAAFCTNGSRLTPTDCRTETEMGPIVLSGRDISNLLPKVARTGRELLGIAFVKPAAKNLGLKPFIPCCFCNICCLSWRNDIWFEMCFLGDGDFAHGGPWGKCSRKEFDLVYQRLNIQGLQERNALWLGMASVGLTGNCTQHIQKISKVVRFIMINIRCTQNQKGVFQPQAPSIAEL